jgi:putative transposase
MFTNKPEHLKTFDYLGLHRYFLTFCTFERRRLLIETDRVELVMLHIRRTAGEQGMAVLAYCCMPDHLHLLVEGQSEDSDCRRFIARAKQFSGFYFKRTFGGPLWQRYGYERTLRDG